MNTARSSQKQQQKVTIQEEKKREKGKAYVDLYTLQQFRYVAKGCLTSRHKKRKILLGGHHKNHAVNRGMEFEEVRQYQPGDDVRSIDWRVTARTQVTHSKRYSEEKEKPIITAVDQRHSTFFGSHPYFKSVHSCYLAALINWASLHSGDRSGGIVLGSKNISETRAVRSHKIVNRWLQQLCNANQELSSVPTSTPEPLLSELLERIIHTIPIGSNIYIISDFYDLDLECEKLLFYMTRHHQITLLWVMDQLEISLPRSAHLSISNGRNTTTLTVCTDITTAFEKQFLEKQERLVRLAQDLRIRLVNAPVQRSPVDIIAGSLNL